MCGACACVYACVRTLYYSDRFLYVIIAGTESRVHAHAHAFIPGPRWTSPNWCAAHHTLELGRSYATSACLFCVCVGLARSGFICGVIGVLFGWGLGLCLCVFFVFVRCPPRLGGMIVAARFSDGGTDILFLAITFYGIPCTFRAGPDVGACA